VRFHRLSIRQYDFGCICFNGARLQSGKRLVYDLVRLFHLSHPNHVAGPDIAILLRGDFKVVILVAAVRIRPPNIQLNSTPSQAWTRKAPIDRILSGNVTDTLRAPLEDLVAGE